ncbi:MULTISPECIES: MarR family winged helix-turn-helix transcriptional regulator [Kitasatospora]|uniref:MarR family transcriptional regulator n=2 Tax=Kitasatosporales TaxID=85011 RepID=A0ABZ1UCS6_9ACTN|nr:MULTISPECIES: MarR family transcriptional regulator [Kitasatospora]MCX4685384.1 MarR family transcriptional regulator [Kitasatospora purpeofusca]MCX4752649.1 MarR family transcriptional regulator [Kitasatospora purpeofusca]MDY0811393.1 MarR family transcriptional regulator [Kitasatospora purpeofusca]WSR37205.1 MarR family transcriptional regulator [Kitasatospora purpeofusca]WSR45437.1 MarR family transcriptional regulator [Kitasatospora purpeofusca]
MGTMDTQPTRATAPQTDEITREVVDLMANLVALFHREYEEAAAARSLTGAQAKVLALLRRGPMPMRQIAQTLSCEPSNITGIVDRLETRGFVTRQPDLQDRRVKLVAATETGAGASEELRESLNFAREPLAALDSEERTQLRDLLRRMLTGATGPGA